MVTLDALAPFRKAFTRPASDPQPLPYLDSSANSEHGAFDIYSFGADGRKGGEGKDADLGNWS